MTGQLWTIVDTKPPFESPHVDFPENLGVQSLAFRVAKSESHARLYHDLPSDVFLEYVNRFFQAEFL